jgi:hypothetical protein
MGIDKNFFSKPIPVPITFLKNTVNEKGEVIQEKVTMLFLLRREKNKEATEYAIASILGNGANAEELKLAHFCNLLIEAPTGFDDFPDDDRELKERAKEYFSGEQYEPLIRAIMIFYEQSTTPLEAYRSV